MKLLIHAIHYPVASARYAVDAYRRLGHEVCHIGDCTGRHIWGLSLPEQYIWPPEPPPDGWAPDLAILMDTAYQWHHESAPTVVHSVDNHVRDLRQPGIDHYFLAHRNVSVMDWQADMTHLPCSYDPTLHTPSPIPFEDRAYDVCMIGVMYERRWQLVQALRDAGFKVLAGTGLVYENYRDAYQNARISLCLSSNGDVAQRVFETARMGCVVMSDNCADYPILKPDGIWLLDDLTPETVVQAVRDVLHEPEHAQAMIARSMAWAEPYSWTAGARKVVEWYERRN